MADIDSLVSVDWLSANIDRSDIKTIDGTWTMPGDDAPLPGQFIPGAQSFDIDAIADQTSSMSHMLPTSQTFVTEISKLGISSSDHVIIYDRHGFFSAPRVWWTFQMFGHSKVSILDGGLPAWIKAGHKTASEPATSLAASHYEARRPLSSVSSQSNVLKSLGTDVQVLDARPAGRFQGTSPEPRAGLRSGHIPGSFNLPFGSTRTNDMQLKDITDLTVQIDEIGLDLSKPIITTCGSGITAAGLAFVLHLMGAKDVSVYDGSWTEWGASNAPIER